MRTIMISYEEFEDIVVNTLKRNISSNEDQIQILKHWKKVSRLQAILSYLQY